MVQYKIKNGTLKVLSDLRRDFDLSFDQICSDLLESPEKKLTIDLGHISYINSTYIGMIAATYFQAQTRGKDLKVVAQNSVLQVLRAAGFDGFIKLQQAETRA